MADPLGAGPQGSAPGFLGLSGTDWMRLLGDPDVGLGALRVGPPSWIRGGGGFRPFAPLAGFGQIAQEREQQKQQQAFLRKIAAAFPEGPIRDAMLALAQNPQLNMQAAAPWINALALLAQQQVGQEGATTGAGILAGAQPQAAPSAGSAATQRQATSPLGGPLTEEPPEPQPEAVSNVTPIWVPALQQAQAGGRRMTMPQFIQVVNARQDLTAPQKRAAIEWAKSQGVPWAAEAEAPESQRARAAHSTYLKARQTYAIPEDQARMLGNEHFLSGADPLPDFLRSPAGLSAIRAPDASRLREVGRRYGLPSEQIDDIVSGFLSGSESYKEALDRIKSDRDLERDKRIALKNIDSAIQRDPSQQPRLASIREAVESGNPEAIKEANQMLPKHVAGIGEVDPLTGRVIQEQAPSTDYQTFYRAMKAQGKSDYQISGAWKQRQVEVSESKAAAGIEEKRKAVDIKLLAQAVSNGQEAIADIRNAWGMPISTQVQTEVLKMYPKFNFVYSNANARWPSNASNQRTIGMINGALPRVDMLVDQLGKLPNVTIPAINAVMRQVSIQTGQPVYADFESNRNAIVQEINTALSGSATGSDFRVQIELQNLKATRSPAQIKASIGNLREALLARLEPSLSPLYPIEVVRGEKSVGQYMLELRKKYHGKYPATQDVEGMAVGTPTGPTLDFRGR